MLAVWWPLHRSCSLHRPVISCEVTTRLPCAWLVDTWLCDMFTWLSTALGVFVPLTVFQRREYNHMKSACVRGLTVSQCSSHRRPTVGWSQVTAVSLVNTYTIGPVAVRGRSAVTHGQPTVTGWCLSLIHIFAAGTLSFQCCVLLSATLIYVCSSVDPPSLRQWPHYAPFNGVVFDESDLHL